MSALRDKINAQRASIAAQKAAFERPYRFKVGKTLFRVLPGIDDVDEFSKPYGAHYIKNPTDGKVLAVVGDSEICYGKPCPIREAINKVIQQRLAMGDEASAKSIKGWLARDSYVVNIEIIGGVDTENKGKVVRYEFTRNQYDEILSLIDTVLLTNPSFNLNDGLAVMVERTGTTKNDTEYKWSAVPGNVPPPTQAILDQRTDLKAYVDGKFGVSVTKALTALSSMLGEDLTQTAIGSAISNSAQLTGPSATQTTAVALDDEIPDFTKVEPAAVDADFEELANLTTTEAPAQPVQQTAPAAASTDEFADILAELDGM